MIGSGMVACDADGRSAGREVPAAGKEVDVRGDGMADTKSDCACGAAAVGVELVSAAGTVEVPLAEAV